MEKLPMGASRTLLLILVAAIVSIPDARADGRIEINQAMVDAAGGFPFVISAPGNYVLTGNLSVPAARDGFVLNTTDVVFDLNGFAIVGPSTCVQGACAAGAGSGIRSGNSVAFGHHSAVRNGAVRGFAGTCVQLTSFARVAELDVRICGRAGIFVANGSVVTSNRVAQTGQHGIWMSGSAQPSTYAHNAVASAGLGGGGEAAISGGRAAAGNSCDDGSCSPRGERRFYLTKSSHDGSQARSACDTGFHMASLFEILDPSSLHYDVTRGVVEEDSGSGPASASSAWIRTGKPSGISSSLAGGLSCFGYTTAGVNTNGTRAHLNWLWEDHTEADPYPTTWWTAVAASCSSSRRVWCVED